MQHRITLAFLTLTKRQGHTWRSNITDVEESAFSECFLFAIFSVFRFALTCRSNYGLCNSKIQFMPFSLLWQTLNLTLCLKAVIRSLNTLFNTKIFLILCLLFKMVLKPLFCAFAFITGILKQISRSNICNF